MRWRESHSAAEIACMRIGAGHQPMRQIRTKSNVERRATAETDGRTRPSMFMASYHEYFIAD